jgi:hypothetical protein
MLYKLKKPLEVSGHGRIIQKALWVFIPSFSSGRDSSTAIAAVQIY